MKLRDRQQTFSDRCHVALNLKGNTLGVAPTGAGKTVMMAHIIGRQRLQHGAMVLQHRDELVRQNRDIFRLLCPQVSTGEYTSTRKELGYGCTFAMVNTIARDEGLARMPPLDLLAVDEGHHAAADSYQRVIHQARRVNPAVKLLLVTATPNRGDKKALRGIVDNCADQITIKELIDAKHLVPPRTFVIDLGVREDLSRVRRTASDFDMLEVEAIMDKEVLNDRVVEEWKRLAGNRQTVVFCSTVAHARHVCAAFCGAGVSAVVVDGSMSDGERRSTLAGFDRGEFQVIVNVAVLTEGWDCQPVACVILLRPSSFKSTMIQMIGRGLRKLDPERYPGRRKDDCVVLDFGTSVLQHGDLDQRINIDAGGVKICPDCNATVPSQTLECPICSYAWPVVSDDRKDQTDEAANDDVPADPGAKEQLADFRLTEIDLLIDRSPFKWEPFWDGAVCVASAFDAWAMVIQFDGRWHALAGVRGQGVRHLADNGERLLSLASADDFLREHGDSDAGNKAKRWLNQPATEKQLQQLGMSWQDAFAMTRYQAACRITFKWNERAIRARLEHTRRIAA